MWNGDDDMMVAAVAVAVVAIAFVHFRCYINPSVLFNIIYGNLFIKCNSNRKKSDDNDDQGATNKQQQQPNGKKMRRRICLFGVVVPVQC